jgi:hypothetical protein
MGGLVHGWMGVLVTNGKLALVVVFEGNFSLYKGKINAKYVAWWIPTNFILKN